MLNYNSFDQFLSDEFWDAFTEARKGKRRTVDEHRFELNASENLINLREDALRGTYKPSRGIAFISRDPVVREIVAAPFRDRIIHHFLFRCCADWWDRHLTVDSYSCRKGKGTLFGQHRCRRHLGQVTLGDTAPALVAKLDIQGYFMSLKHQLLYDRVCWGLDQQFFHTDLPDPDNAIRCQPHDRLRLYNLLKFLWHQVIFDTPMDGIALRGKPSDWDDLPPSKSLFNQPPGQGIVIGNLTSQLLSNIFMDQGDRFIRYNLGYQHYGRYVDDFFIATPIENHSQLVRDIETIRQYLHSELSLTLHPNKTHLQTADKGFEFIGAKIFPTHIAPGRRSKRNLYRAAYRFATQGEGDLEGLVSRLGSLKHIKSRNLQKQVFDTFGWEFDWMPDDEWINREKWDPNHPKKTKKRKKSDEKSDK